MGDQTELVHAQLVMKRSDGTSILTQPPRAITGVTGAGDVPSERVDEIRERLEDIGFTIEAGNLNTLSVAGPADLFAKTFGLTVAAMPTSAPLHAKAISPELSGYVADVFVMPPPELF